MGTENCHLNTSGSLNSGYCTIPDMKLVNRYKYEIILKQIVLENNGTVMIVESNKYSFAYNYISMY